MKDRIKALIIDLDNVLYDTELFHYMSWKTMCSEAGLAFDREGYKRIEGMEIPDALETILRANPLFSAPPALRDMLSTKVRLLYRQYLASLTPAEVSDSVRSTLRELKDRGYILMAYSSGENAANVLEKLGLDGAFDHIYSEGIVPPHRRDAAPFEKMREILGVESGECLVLDSTDGGLASAAAAGMMRLGVGAGAALECDGKLDGFSDVLDWLKA